MFPDPGGIEPFLSEEAMADLALGLDLDDLTPVEIPFSYQNKPYLLCEATEAVAVAYKNKLTRAVKLGPDGKPTSVEDIASVEPFLVGGCVYTVKSDGTKDKQVGESAVQQWSYRLTSRLYAKAQEISNLEVGADSKDALVRQRVELDRRIAALESNGDALKNVSSATTDTSA